MFSILQFKLRKDIFSSRKMTVWQRSALLLGAAFCGMAEEAASVSGFVRGHQENGLRGVELQAQNESTGARWKTFSDEEGKYHLAGLPTGIYRVRARMPGFRTASRNGIELSAGTNTLLDFGLEMVALRETITIVSGGDELDPASGDALVLARESPGSSLPNNGRDFRSSFDLMPGVIITPAGVSDAGQFTSQGQRPNANTFQVDGVSANTGVGGSTMPGSFPGASLPAMNATGTTENLVSPDTTQSVALHTSNFAPEFGERTGSLVSIQTRSGSAEFHGAASLQARDNSWTASDWFANSRGIPYPRSTFGNVNGVLGGPIIRNRTFFFISGEASALRDAAVQLTSVPSMTARSSAPEALLQLLQDVPPPTGPDFGNGQAEGLLTMTRHAVAKNFSGRVDHALGSSGHLFGRYNWAPSTSRARRFSMMQGDFGWKSVTLGATFGKRTIHDARLNFSRSSFNSFGEPYGRYSLLMEGLATVRPYLETQFFGVLGSTGALSVADVGQFVWGESGKTRQDQGEVRYSLARTSGAHQVRAGVSYLLLNALRYGNGGVTAGSAPSLESIVKGEPIQLQTWNSGGRNLVHIGSVFLQDTVRIRESLQLVYGVRWEITPPVSRSIGQASYLVVFNDQDFQLQKSISASTPWLSNYKQLAPRIGLAYRVPGSFVLRAGAGLFFDTRLGAAIHPINGAPFNSWWLPPGAGTGLGNASFGNVPVPDTPPDVQQFVSGPYAGLRLPASYQWRVSLEKRLSGGGAASMSYIGSAGRNLLGNQIYFDPSTGQQRQFVTQTQNRSSYHAMELRYGGNLSSNLYGSAAYTWSHSIDDASQDSSLFLIHPNYNLREAWASSNFDVRQAFTSALSYRIPVTQHLPWSLSNWTVSGIFRLRSGFPINVVGQEQPMGRNFVNWGRPDYVSGAPIWIPDQNVAGGRRLNRDAFQVAPSERVGTLGRNIIRGYGLEQIDISLRRDFAVGSSTLQVGLNIFNFLNHPSFADPVPYLASPWFGQATSMQNLMLGSGSPNSGLPAMFQAGGSRSAEISLRLSF